MMADDPYSRLYWRLSDEFPTIYDDDASLALWVRLLVAADQAWPAAPFLPAFADDAALAHLVAAELVSVNGTRYRIRGLDKERKRRRKSARKGANARWSESDAQADADALAHAIADANAYQDADANADANADAVAMPSRAKPSRDEPRKAKTRQAAGATKSQKTRRLTPLNDILGVVSADG